jgi:predicted ester cyclase
MRIQKLSIVALSTTALAIAALTGSPTANAKRETARQVMDRFFAVVDSKALDKLGEVDDAELVMQTPMGMMKGVEGHRQMLTGFATAFPNFKHNTSRCIESGDLISCEGLFTGDHTGPLMMPDGRSVPATKKHVEFTYAGIARVKSGKVAELHVYFDNMGFMMQLGLVPAPAKVAAR